MSFPQSYEWEAEIVAPAAYVHLERMGRDSWWLSVVAGGREVHVTLTARNRTTIDAIVEHQLAPPGVPTPEGADQ